MEGVEGITILQKKNQIQFFTTSKFSVHKLDEFLAISRLEGSNYVSHHNLFEKLSNDVCVTILEGPRK